MASVVQNARETHNVHFGIMSLKGAANCDGLEGCLFIDTLLTPVAEKYCTRYSGVSLTRKSAKNATKKYRRSDPIRCLAV